MQSLSKVNLLTKNACKLMAMTLEAAWHDMRECHVREAQTFVFKHQQLYTQFFAKQVSHERLADSLLNILEEYFLSDVCVVPWATQEAIKTTVPQYLSLFLCAEASHAKNRIKAQSDANKKKVEEELRAEENSKRQTFVNSSAWQP